MSRIYYTKPSITDLEVIYVTDAAKNGWGDKCYDYLFNLRFQNATNQLDNTSRITEVRKNIARIQTVLT